MNHTQGPWRLCFDHPDLSYRNDIGYIRASSGMHAEQCCEIATIYSCDHLPEQAANARLIAVAPEGYELAVEILRAFDETTGRIMSDVTREEMEPIRKLAEALLNKAAK